jgi:hypothetical protein
MSPPSCHLSGGRNENIETLHNLNLSPTVTAIIHVLRWAADLFGKLKILIKSFGWIISCIAAIHRDKRRRRRRRRRNICFIPSDPNTLKDWPSKFMFWNLNLPFLMFAILQDYIHICLWSFDPISGHGLPLRGFAIVLIGHTTLDRTHMGEWSARRRGLYLTTHYTHKRQTSMPPAEFEPTITPSERPLWSAVLYRPTFLEIDVNKFSTY